MIWYHAKCRYHELTIIHWLLQLPLCLYHVDFLIDGSPALGVCDMPAAQSVSGALSRNKRDQPSCRTHQELLNDRIYTAGLYTMQYNTIHFISYDSALLQFLRFSCLSSISAWTKKTCRLLRYATLLSTFYWLLCFHIFICYYSDLIIYMNFSSCIYSFYTLMLAYRQYLFNSLTAQ